MLLKSLENVLGNVLEKDLAEILETVLENVRKVLENVRKVLENVLQKF